MWQKYEEGHLLDSIQSLEDVNQFALSASCATAMRLHFAGGRPVKSVRPISPFDTV